MKTTYYIKINQILLGGAPACICHLFRPPVRPSVCPFVAHHISGTVHHLLIVFGTRV